MQAGENQPDKKWQKTKYANLVRYVPSGVLFARIRVRGKLIRQSLKTSDLAIGRRKLIELEARERGLVQQRRDGKVTGSDVLTVLRERVNARPSTKARTKLYYIERIEGFLRSWPEFEGSDIRKTSERECENWAEAFAKKASASVYNHTLGIVKSLFEIAIDCGARYDNPARKIKRVKEHSKKLQLPSSEQFQRFVAEIENSGSGHSKPCADLVRFLTYGGFRKMEAANVTRADCDFANSRIMVYGDPENRTKNGEFRAVPMIPEMRKLLDRIWADRPKEPATTPVMRVRECQKAMDRAATKVPGMKRLTHHDLRHLFATRCIESGVPIPTVAKWLGHKDRGALAMKTYGHLRDEHSQEMAAKVRFS